MLALFGEWGSGKTTIIKYLEKELADSLKVVFFEAWKHEKDGNLPFSLLDAICETLRAKEQLKQSVIQFAYTAFKAFAKSATINLGIVSIDNRTFIADAEKELESTLSLYKTNKELENKFQELEKELLKEKNRLIVFVDDLDRCEPENILNLLSAIKLFFTYGKRTIYFCAIDKDAVNKAVKIKYGDVIKSGEYLEKIFDISFNMPMAFDLQQLLKYYFAEATLDSTRQDYQVLIQKLVLFFEHIAFTNPRHVKKVLNKYLIVQYCKANKIGNHEQIPEIEIKTNGSIINVIFVLYFIILYEFYPSKFRELEQYEMKIDKYRSAYHAHFLTLNPSDKTLKASGNAISSVVLREAKQITFRDIAKNLENDKETFLPKLLTLFTPYPKQYFDIPPPTGEEYLDQFESPDEEILTGFCRFLCKNEQAVKNNKLDYRLWTLFDMAKTIL